MNEKLRLHEVLSDFSLREPSVAGSAVLKATNETREYPLVEGHGLRTKLDEEILFLSSKVRSKTCC